MPGKALRFFELERLTWYNGPGLPVWCRGSRSCVWQGCFHSCTAFAVHIRKGDLSGRVHPSHKVRPAGSVSRKSDVDRAPSKPTRSFLIGVRSFVDTHTGLLKDYMLYCWVPGELRLRYSIARAEVGACHLTKQARRSQRQREPAPSCRTNCHHGLKRQRTTANSYERRYLHCASDYVCIRKTVNSLMPRGRQKRRAFQFGDLLRGLVIEGRSRSGVRRLRSCSYLPRPLLFSVPLDGGSSSRVEQSRSGTPRSIRTSHTFCQSIASMIRSARLSTLLVLFLCLVLVPPLALGHGGHHAQHDDEVDVAHSEAGSSIEAAHEHQPPAGHSHSHMHSEAPKLVLNEVRS